MRLSNPYGTNVNLNSKLYLLFMNFKKQCFSLDVQMLLNSKYNKNLTSEQHL